MKEHSFGKGGDNHFNKSAIDLKIWLKINR